jgi:dTMP kinase
MSTLHKGRFISLEGTEGAGKSSAMALVGRLLAQAGIDCIQTREPGGTALGESLRHLLLEHRGDGICQDAELLLMFAARAEHLAKVIRPALDAGRWVLCDRFTDASRAYQGSGRGMNPDHIRQLEAMVVQGQQPDLTVLLDLPVAQGLERAGRRSAPDRFERESLAFFESVRQGYLEIARTEPKRVKLIDASRPLPEVETQIAETLGRFLNESLPL